MAPTEIILRLHDRLNQFIWRLRYYNRGTAPRPTLVSGELRFRGGLKRHHVKNTPAAARADLLRFADNLLNGRWTTFAIHRDDVNPNLDWHLDAKSRMHVPSDTYSFDIRTYGEDIGFDTKYVWELSRHRQTTVLSMAYWLTGKEIYANEATAYIASWLKQNKFLNGIHWISGIELGMRLIAFVWARRLLEGWSGAADSFENDDSFVASIYQHQWLLAHRMSFGSSANNHLIYEAAGLYISSATMPWFVESEYWCLQAKKVLEREFVRQTFPSGYNRELASDYNGFVLEALLLCLVEGKLTGPELGKENWETAGRIVRTLSDLSDCRCHPPNQGDGDNADGLLLDAPTYDRWVDLLYFGARWFGSSVPPPRIDEPPLRSWLIASLVRPPHIPESLPFQTQKSVAQEVGLVVLRGQTDQKKEIYCVFDAGPLGYLSIAAHGHADALAIELRYDGIPLLIDSGTFNYTSARCWREYFRSTAAHNTLELGGISQSKCGGPFLWTRHARAELLKVEGLEEEAPIATCVGEHTGYRDTSFAGKHKRSVFLDRIAVRLDIIDEISVSSPTICRLFFHLHPSISCELTGHTCILTWNRDKDIQTAQIKLPSALTWRTVVGSEEPLLGWYSPAYDVKIPTTTVVGEGRVNTGMNLQTRIYFGADK